MTDAYAAGFFDGEGCVLIYKRAATCLSPKSASPPYQIRVTLTNTHEGVIQDIQRTYGGNVCAYLKPKARRRPAWKWNASCQKAVAFLRAVRPHLIVKGEQADLAIGLQVRIEQTRHNTHLGRKGAMAIDPEELAAREAIWQQMRAIREAPY